MLPDWAKEFGASITVCDENGILLYLNEKARSIFETPENAPLVGKSMFDCHKQASQEMIRAMMATKKPHVYTIEKKGVKKLIYQAPWFENGVFKGLVELSMELPAEVPPHRVR
ncbi:MAG TPA: PAS sensor protein [bacterium]|nr:PAS sensor protein [bacterium]